MSATLTPSPSTAADRAASGLERPDDGGPPNSGPTATSRAASAR